MRKVIHCEQGDATWHAHRSTPGQINGSEIAAIMGIDKKTSRSELLRMKALGGEKEFSDYVQKQVIDKGHEYEAMARPLAEAIIDDDLSPLVMTDTIDGVLISVSLDGITQGYDTTFEHKSLNMMLADALDAGMLPEEYHPQCEAGLMVSGATRCLFMASKDGDPETARHFWYESNTELRPRMIAACKQFLEDRANYAHVETVAVPVAATIEALPALFVQVEGKVLATNLDAFKAAAQTFIDGIKTELVNDQDFADADKMVKFLKDGEERLALAKSQALAQTASIDELFRTVDVISEQMRSKRLALDKLVKSEKDNRRAYIVAEAQQELVAHVTKLNERIGGNWMPRTAVSFADAIRGLKSLDSMRDKVATALANAKIEANEIADRIQANRLEMTGELDWSFLFPDFAAVCTKARDDFDSLLMARIAKHNEAQAAKDAANKAAEEARIATAVEAERKAGEARAAAAVEAERIAEAKRVAEAERMAAAKLTENNQTQFEVQRGKADAGSNASGEVADVGSIPHPVTASTPPIPSDEAAIDSFIQLLSIGVVEKKALRVNILKWEKFRVARSRSHAEAL